MIYLKPNDYWEVRDLLTLINPFKVQKTTSIKLFSIFTSYSKINIPWVNYILYKREEITIIKFKKNVWKTVFHMCKSYVNVFPLQHLRNRTSICQLSSVPTPGKQPTSNDGYSPYCHPLVGRLPVIHVFFTRPG